MSLRKDILTAARADSIPAGESGPWSVRKWDTANYPKLHADDGRMVALQQGKLIKVKPGNYTSLMRVTLATMHKDQGGECVMTDTENELETHLDFMLHAHGRVLKTGLGLGCVVRGLLVNPAVRFVVVIERDADVLRLVAPHMPRDRVSIVHADALEWCERNKGTFDCAWHDIWSDEDKGEPDLAISHQSLLLAMRKKVKTQGAWAFPRPIRRILREGFETP